MMSKDAVNDMIQTHPYLTKGHTTWTKERLCEQNVLDNYRVRQSTFWERAVKPGNAVYKK